LIIEEKILRYLKGRIGVPVYMERPANSDPSFLIVERVGGSEGNYISHGTFAIKSIGTTLYEAAILDHEVVKAMRDLSELENISSCILNADTNFTDTTTKEYRYQSTYLIDYMED
jgi:hypothetical protein